MMKILHGHIVHVNDGGTMRENKIDKILEWILHDAELTTDEKTLLLSIKRVFENNMKIQTKLFTSAQFIVFFRRYRKQISRWIGQPIAAVEEKIESKSFNEVEISLIITNLFLIQLKEMDEINESNHEDY